MAEQTLVSSLCTSNIDSVVSFIWISAVMRMQEKILRTGEGISVQDAANEFLSFIEDDETPVGTVKLRYYRMLEKEREVRKKLR